jgi:hypothetical protein
MNILYKCVTCKKEQYGDEYQTHCQYCHADTLMETDADEDLTDIAETKLMSYWIDKVLG